jgi:hypothetical protein
MSGIRPKTELKGCGKYADTGTNLNSTKKPFCGIYRTKNIGIEFYVDGGKSRL